MHRLVCAFVVRNPPVFSRRGPYDLGHEILVLIAKAQGKALENLHIHVLYSKTCVKWPLKNRQNKDLNDKWKLNEGRKFCRMLPLEHSAILLTCIKR